MTETTSLLEAVTVQHIASKSDVAFVFVATSRLYFYICLCFAKVKLTMMESASLYKAVNTVISF